MTEITPGSHESADLKREIISSLRKLYRLNEADELPYIEPDPDEYSIEFEDAGNGMENVYARREQKGFDLHDPDDPQNRAKVGTFPEAQGNAVDRILRQLLDKQERPWLTADKEGRDWL